MTVPLLHITTSAAWHATGSEVRAASLESEGFVHCSTPDQVLIPANERFRGERDLVLLVLDPDLIEADVVFEDCYDSGHAFPHVYGPVPRSAVVSVVDFPPDADGLFRLPEAVPRRL